MAGPYLIRDLIIQLASRINLLQNFIFIFNIFFIFFNVFIINIFTKIISTLRVACNYFIYNAICHFIIEMEIINKITIVKINIIYIIKIINFTYLFYLLFYPIISIELKRKFLLISVDMSTDL